MKKTLSGLIVIILVTLTLTAAFRWLNQPTIEELHFSHGEPLTAEGEWEDMEYWVLFRNVTLVDERTGKLKKDRYVLVIGNHIHKIGVSPILIFDMDLSYNFDCEGRIIIPASLVSSDHTATSYKTATIDEGNRADLLIIDGTTINELHTLIKTNSTTLNTPMMVNDSIRLIMTAGVIIKDEMVNKRIDQSRLQQAIRRRNLAAQKE